MSEGAASRRLPPPELVAGGGALGWGLGVALGSALGAPLGIALVLAAWRALPVALGRAFAPASLGWLAVLPLLPPWGSGKGVTAALAVASAAVLVATPFGHALRHPRSPGGRWLGVAVAAATPLATLALLVPGRVVLVDAGEVAGGYAIPGLRAVVGGLTLAGFVAMARRRVSGRGARRALVWIGLPVLGLGLGFRYRVHARAIDSRAEGAALAAAEAWDQGARPWRDLRLEQGLGVDLVRPKLAFALFGRSLRGLRVLDDLLAAANVAAVVLVGSAVLPLGGAALFALAVLAGAAPVAVGGSTLLADLALAALLLALHAPRPGPRVALACGVAVALAVLWCPGTALCLVPAGLVAVLVPSGMRGTAWRDRMPVLAAFAAGAAPALLGLGLGPGLGSVGTESRPIEGPASAVLSVAAVVLAGRWSRGGLGRRERLLLILWVATAAGGGAGPRLVWPLAFASAMALGRAGAAAAAAIGLALLMVPGTGVPGLAALGRDLAGRQRIDITGTSAVDRARIGVLLPAAEARRLSALLAVLDRLPAGARFHDFTNRPELYFLAGRAAPVPIARTGATGRAGGERERAVVTALAAEPPALVVYRSASPGDGGEGRDNRLRHPLIAEWIATRFRPRASVSGFLLLVPQTHMTTPPPEGAVFDTLELGALAAEWGQAPATTAGSPLESTPSGDGGYPIAVPDAARGSLTGLVLAFTAQSPGSARLTWRTPGVSGEVGFAFSREAGRHSYLLPLALHPGWVWAETIEGPVLRLDGEWPGDLRAEAVTRPLAELLPR